MLAAGFAHSSDLVFSQEIADACPIADSSMTKLWTTLDQYDQQWTTSYCQRTVGSGGGRSSSPPSLGQFSFDELDPGFDAGVVLARRLDRPITPPCPLRDVVSAARAEMHPDSIRRSDGSATPRF